MGTDHMGQNSPKTQKVAEQVGGLFEVFTAHVHPAHNLLLSEIQLLRVEALFRELDADNDLHIEMNELEAVHGALTSYRHLTSLLLPLTADSGADCSLCYRRSHCRQWCYHRCLVHNSSHFPIAQELQISLRTPRCGTCSR